VLKVLFVASEAAPFVKTGGLGEVIGSLPAALRSMGVDARVIIPKYRAIAKEFRDGIKYLKHIYISLNWRNLYCGIEEYEQNGVPVYFIDNMYYFDRDYLYGYGDQEVERYAFFCKAVLEVIGHLDFIPDIIHCHDWQTGMLPFLLKVQYKTDTYANIRTLYTVHNLKYQGLFPKRLLGDILGVGDEYFTSDKLEFNGNVNSLKAGLVYSDIISTVSPSYALEIQYPHFGEGLDGLLRARNNQLYGVLNGVDYEAYNPKTDTMIFENYDADDWKQGKAVNKMELQKTLGLSVKPDVPILGIVSRLVSQKGWDLLARVLKEVLELDLQIVVLGGGESSYEDMFKYAAYKNPEKVAVNIGYDDTLAHRIYAGSDMFLMPSLFEPCGLGQLFSLRYGTIPIVRETGGLKDTVKPFNEFTNDGNGFSFTNYNAHDMLYTINRALSFYSKPDIWDMLVKRAMSCDFSWERSAEKYVEIYNKMIC
jgi:starch synthase